MHSSPCFCRQEQILPISPSFPSNSAAGTGNSLIGWTSPLIPFPVPASRSRQSLHGWESPPSPWRATPQSLAPEPHSHTPSDWNPGWLKTKKGTFLLPPPPRETSMLSHRYVRPCGRGCSSSSPMGNDSHAPTNERCGKRGRGGARPPRPLGHWGTRPAVRQSTRREQSRAGKELI